MSSRLPSTDPLVALADRCVQCGLCLPACPTYSHDRLEAESPRGRIALARAWALGTVDATPAGDAHLDHCLGCRSCETVCPAGVEYGQLLVAARAQQRARRPAGPRQRLVEWVSARPRVLKAALALYRACYPLLPALLRPLPRPAGSGAAAPRTPGSEPAVALFVGCIAHAYEGKLRDAVARLCAEVGVTVYSPAAQACCGTLHAHAGNVRAHAELAAANRAAFAGSDTVLTLASGCHESVAHALAGTSDTWDAIAFLAARAGSLRLHETRERVALHLPCTQRNLVKSVTALRALLARVPGLQVVELSDGHGCCGAAGTQMLHDSERAAEYRAPLLAQLQASGATRLLSANIGCRLHFMQGTTIPVQHPLEFLAECLASPPPAGIQQRPASLESTRPGQTL